MNTYQIFIMTEHGYAYYSKTPIYTQACEIKAKLEAKGYTVRLRKNGVWVD